VASQTRERLLRDRAHLLGALRDCQRGKIPPLPEAEFTILVECIERRLEDIERKLSAIELGRT
jgi:hypothetical protein